MLESCFGKLKGLEDGQSKSGFTGLVLSLGAIVSKRSIETIGEVLERCRVRDVWDWCREKLGVSVQSLRKQAYTKTKWQQIPDDREVGTRPSFHHVRARLRPRRVAALRHAIRPVPESCDNSGQFGVLQPIMPLDLPVKVRPWELTVYPRSHIRR